MNHTKSETHNNQHPRPYTMTLTFTANPTYPTNHEIVRLWLLGFTNVIIDRTKGYSEKMEIEPDELYDMIDRFDRKYFNGMPPVVSRLAEQLPETNKDARDCGVFEYLLV